MEENNQRVFIDSNFFVALFNPHDTLHPRTIDLSQKIRREKPSLFSTNFIFLEVVTVLSQRVSRTVAISFGRHLLGDKQIEIFQIDAWLQNLSWQIFQKIKKKDVGFVDCSILAVMDTERIGKLLTFDQEDFASLRKQFKFDFYA